MGAGPQAGGPSRRPGSALELERGPGIASSSPWQGGYREAVERGLELVESGALRKLVLAVRQHLELDQPLDPLRLLAHLRQRQPGSCRFLWQQGEGTALLGASPERLLAVRQGRLRSDALAGTAPIGPLADQLTTSGKDRHEHELVVEAITQALWKAGLAPHRPRHPRLARHGQLVHLHTPITAALGDQQPLALAEALHPTPAVAGLPRRQAMAWLRSLEPFERGHYAAPIGWIDNGGDAELRVAIRSGSLRGRQLVLTAGAGLVRGSVPERELQEVALKLGVLQQQLNLPVTEPPGGGGSIPPGGDESGRQQALHGEVGQGDAPQPLHLPHPGGAGDVDLTEQPVDHIDAHEEEAFSAEGGGDLAADLTLGLVELAGYGGAAQGQVAAEFTGHRQPVHRPEGLAIHQQDPLVSRTHPRQKGLGHHGHPLLVGDQLQQRPEARGLGHGPAQPPGRPSPPEA